MPLPAYVVLGMVSLGARSGYEIKQDVERSIRFFWTISQAQIYPCLRRLEHEGFVMGTDQPAGRRRRRLYKITDSGQEVLRSWLTAAEPIPFELRDVGLLKLFFADALSPAEAGTLLAVVRRRSEERVATLSAIRTAAYELRDDGNAFPLLSLEMGIAFHEAMAEVCARFAGDVQALGSDIGAATTSGAPLRVRG
ncbi:MAG TPA: PadR family transcriptional regulator [Acidimicrobiales bacterium]|nr:PadR family transcriptional regulator [Acidimicrobiales bacterium]